MTPEEARDHVVDVVTDTVEIAGADDWAFLHDGSPSPDLCSSGSQDGVSFGYGAYTTTLGSDPATDAQRVADYWETLGIRVRVVSDPVPSVFGQGGPVKAISFTTAPTYAISAGGICVPGDPFDYYDDTPSPSA